MLQVFLLLLLAGRVMAQEPADAKRQIRLPADFDRVDFYLITVDVGNHIWDNFGHTALRMVDEGSDTDLLFNWGLFDTTGGYLAFTAKFALGVMDYRLGVAPPAWELGRYRQEQRTVWQDRINLTANQKERLYRRLAWNLQPENMVYQYDYFFDNCTTRVRDYLDEAVQGSIAEQARAQTPLSFRDEVLQHYASLPGVDLSLDVIMNSDVDRQMNRWEHMFLPAQLRQQLLASTSSVYVNGQRLPLLSDSETLIEFEPPAPGPNVYYLLSLLLVPLTLIGLSLRRNSIASFNSSPGFTLRAPHLTYRLLGLLGLLVTLPAGIFGLILSAGWLFSSHQLLHHNLNLLLFWPTDLFGVVLALGWLIRGAAVPMSSTRTQLYGAYLFAHLMAALAYVFLSLTGISAQDTGSLLLYAVPFLVAFTLVAWVAGPRPVRSIRFS